MKKAPYLLLWIQDLFYNKKKWGGKGEKRTMLALFTDASKNKPELEQYVIHYI